MQPCTQCVREPSGPCAAAAELAAVQALHRANGMRPTPTQPAVSEPAETIRQATEQELSRFESEGGVTARGEQRDDRARGLEVRGSDHRGRILLVYAAKQPHTSVIADALATRLRRHGFCVEIGDASAGTMPPPQDYDFVMLGSPMTVSHESDLIARYIEHNREALAEVPSALFTVSSSGTLRDHDPGGFLEKFLRTVRWQPTVAAAFAGGEPFPRNGMMLLLARQRGHEGILQNSDAFRTNWIDVEYFADAVAVELAGAAVNAERTEPHATGH